MNILLLAMSTYPNTVERLIATYGRKRNPYSYYSQLEPSCKHFIKKLGAEKKRFDKIITLCTDESIAAPVGKKYIKDTDIDISGMSPYEFFRRRVSGYIKNDETAFAYEKESGCFDEYCIPFEHPELYPDADDLFETAHIDRNEIEITGTITKVLEIINGLTENKDEEINVYLNAQGGRRNNIQIVNTVLNMLQSRKYTLAEVSIIEYDNDGSEKKKMLDVTSSYLINDMATAMNAFLQYGRADMFVDYYTRYKEIHNRKKTAEDQVVSRINEISNAILLCNTDGFIRGINDLKKAIEKYDSLTPGKKDPFFVLIENDIKKSYKELFDSTDIIADLDVLIKWCLEKNLLQQALTILEAKTPFFVFDYGFLYSKKNDETREALKKLRYPNGRKTSLDYKFKLPKYFLINAFCRMITEDNRPRLNLSRESTMTRELCNGSYRANLTKHPNNSDRAVFVRIYSDWFSKNKQIFREVPDGIDKAGELMKRFICEYQKICGRRNNANHSNSSINFDTLKKQLLDFVNLLTEIKLGAAALKTQKRPFYTDAEIKDDIRAEFKTATE